MRFAAVWGGPTDYHEVPKRYRSSRRQQLSACNCFPQNMHTTLTEICYLCGMHGPRKGKSGGTDWQWATTGYLWVGWSSVSGRQGLSGKYILSFAASSESTDSCRSHRLQQDQLLSGEGPQTPTVCPSLVGSSDLPVFSPKCVHSAG